MLALTAALALLLAVLSHQAWPPVLVSILLGGPALYVAWLAVPGVIGATKRPVYGRLAGRWDPVDLGVHQVIGGGPMPTYVRRPHDDLLRAVLDPAVAASRLVVVRGGSSTGKTRAAYEAVAGRLSDWRVDYPLDAGALAARLEAGIPARTALWLGELRQYADAAGGTAVLGRLADLFDGDGPLVITTVWPEHWHTYIVAARGGPGIVGPAGTAGRLLERLPELTGQDPAGIDPARGGVIDVPDRFTAADLEAAARTGDAVLAEATAAAAGAGQVTQYLAGVPDLLRRYAGPGGDPYGQAVIAAAMDAARLGHASPLPAALLQEAAVGYLTGPQRTAGIEGWRGTALAWATEELHGAVQALQPVPPASGTGVAGYQVADYLDQYGRRTRRDQLGPPSLWDALTAHAASARDLTRLAYAAEGRGLYRHAATLWTTATTLGSPDAAWWLIGHLRKVSPGDTTHAAQWVASHASLDDLRDVSSLLRELRDVSPGNAVTTLAARAAAQASLDDPGYVAWLLGALHEAGTGDAVTTLATRAAHVSLDDPKAIASLLGALREAGISEAAQTLLNRDPAAQASLDNPDGVASLLEELRKTGADDAVTTLATRAVAHLSLDDPGNVVSLLRALRKVGAGGAVKGLLARDPAAQASLDDPLVIGVLLEELREAGAGDAAQALAIRVAAHLSRDVPLSPVEAELRRGYVGALLIELREAGADDAAQALAIRAACHVSLDNPWNVASLLRALQEAGASEAARTLLARDPAAHVSLDDPRAVAELLEELREAGAGNAVTTLATRAAAHVSLDDPWNVAELLKELREAGAGNAVTTLASQAAAHVSLDDPRAVAWLLGALQEAGASEAARTLLARDPAAHVSLDDPGNVAELLEELRRVGAGGAVKGLLARDPAAHVSFDNPWDVAPLLEELREAGAGNAVTTLAIRAANAGGFHLFLKVYTGEASSYRFGREPDGTPSQPWSWQEPANQNRGPRSR